MPAIGGNASSGLIVLGSDQWSVRAYNTTASSALDTIPSLFGVTENGIAGNVYSSSPLILSSNLTEQNILDNTGYLTFVNHFQMTIGMATATQTFRFYVENILKATLAIAGSAGSTTKAIFYLGDLGIKDLKVTAQSTFNSVTLTSYLISVRK